MVVFARWGRTRIGVLVACGLGKGERGERGEGRGEFGGLRGEERVWRMRVREMGSPGGFRGLGRGEEEEVVVYLGEGGGDRRERW